MGATAIAMGLTAAVGAWQAKTEYDANKAQAKQMQANANIAYQNAEKMDAQAHEQAQNNALNQEVKRRQMVQKQKEMENQVGASGLMMSGSNLSVLSDSHYNMMFDLGIDSYNGRQKVDNIFQQSTDQVNQGDIYSAQANQFKKAAKMSLIKNAIQTGASLALMGASSGAGSAGKAGKAAGSAGKAGSSSTKLVNTDYNYVGRPW